MLILAVSLSALAGASAIPAEEQAVAAERSVVDEQAVDEEPTVVEVTSEAALEAASGDPSTPPIAPDDGVEAAEVPGSEEATALDADALPDAEAASELAAEEPIAMEPAIDPAAGEGKPEPKAASIPLEQASAGPPLGAIGYDSEGNQGRIHIVVPADTLWDISDAYLGTPWVWPSIWKDNDQVANPHRIYPGDRIWITPTEMRRISAEEAAEMLANVPSGPAAAEFPVANAEGEPPLDAVPAVVEERGSHRVSARESTGLISAEQLEASASLVGKIPDRLLLSQEDEVYIGLGESDAEVGDQFTIFRTREKVFDPDTGELLGYHVEVLGWLEIKQTFPETSLAEIRMSTGDIELEDRVLPREPIPAEIAILPSPEGVEGKISFFPRSRVLMGYNDFVYLNRGTLDGLDVGSPLDVYRPGYPAEEVVRREKVDVPDRVVAQLLVVRANTEASVALVTHADGELHLGDRFRGAGE
jgi:hypothetical protein